MRSIFLMILTFLVASCAFIPTKKGENVFLQKTSFSSLPGWEKDRHAEAIPPLQKSCALAVARELSAPFGAGGFAGTVADWKPVCEKLSLYLLPTDEESRIFFEENFIPYAVSGAEGAEGLFTGYYEPQLSGSLERKAPYLTPLYGRPSDLVTVNLGDFRADLKGETIMGRVNGEKLVPYHPRKGIVDGVLEKENDPIVWVDSPVDAFFLHIQGSGRVMLEDGTLLRLGYAAQNGHPYFAIGRALVERGALTRENVSMQTIRAWLEGNAGEAPEVMNLNASYVFFKALEGEGPLGAQGVPLTPGRSLAVDRKRMPYGAPLWLDVQEPEGKERLRRLMIAQDTGGAITGAVRGDYFWGAGPEAAHKAGLMKSRGFYYILLPKSITPPLVFSPNKRLDYNN